MRVWGITCSLDIGNLGRWKPQWALSSTVSFSVLSVYWKWPHGSVTCSCLCIKILLQNLFVLYIKKPPPRKTMGSSFSSPLLRCRCFMITFTLLDFHYLVKCTHLSPITTKEGGLLILHGVLNWTLMLFFFYKFTFVSKWSK